MAMAGMREYVRELSAPGADGKPRLRELSQLLSPSLPDEVLSTLLSFVGVGSAPLLLYCAGLLHDTAQAESGTEDARQLLRQVLPRAGLSPVDLVHLFHLASDEDVLAALSTGAAAGRAPRSFWSFPEHVLGAALRPCLSLSVNSWPFGREYGVWALVRVANFARAPQRGGGAAGVTTLLNIASANGCRLCVSLEQGCVTVSVTESAAGAAEWSSGGGGAPTPASVVASVGGLFGKALAAARSMPPPPGPVTLPPPVTATARAPCASLLTGSWVALYVHHAHKRGIMGIGSGAAELSIAVDGVSVLRTALPFPRGLASAHLTAVRIGEGLEGQLGPVYLFREGAGVLSGRQLASLARAHTGEVPVLVPHAVARAQAVGAVEVGETKGGPYARMWAVFNPAAVTWSAAGGLARPDGSTCACPNLVLGAPGPSVAGLGGVTPLCRPSVRASLLALGGPHPGLGALLPILSSCSASGLAMAVRTIARLLQGGGGLRAALATSALSASLLPLLASRLRTLLACPTPHDVAIVPALVALARASAPCPPLFAQAHRLLLLALPLFSACHARMQAALLRAATAAVAAQPRAFRSETGSAGCGLTFLLDGIVAWSGAGGQGSALTAAAVRLVATVLGAGHLCAVEVRVEGFEGREGEEGGEEEGEAGDEAAGMHGGGREGEEGGEDPLAPGASGGAERTGGRGDLTVAEAEALLRAVCSSGGEELPTALLGLLTGLLDWDASHAGEVGGAVPSAPRFCALRALDAACGGERAFFHTALLMLGGRGRGEGMRAAAVRAALHAARAGCARALPALPESLRNVGRRVGGALRAVGNGTPLAAASGSWSDGEVRAPVWAGAAWARSLVRPHCWDALALSCTLTPTLYGVLWEAVSLPDPADLVMAAEGGEGVIAAAQHVQARTRAGRWVGAPSAPQSVHSLVCAPGALSVLLRLLADAPSELQERAIDDLADLFAGPDPFPLLAMARGTETRVAALLLRLPPGSSTGRAGEALLCGMLARGMEGVGGWRPFGRLLGLLHAGARGGSPASPAPNPWAGADGKADFPPSPGPLLASLFAAAFHGVAKGKAISRVKETNLIHVTALLEPYLLGTAAAGSGDGAGLLARVLAAWDGVLPTGEVAADRLLSDPCLQASLPACGSLRPILLSLTYDVLKLCPPSSAHVSAALSRLGRLLAAPLAHVAPPTPEERGSSSAEEVGEGAGAPTRSTTPPLPLLHHALLNLHAFLERTGREAVPLLVSSNEAPRTALAAAAAHAASTLTSLYQAAPYGCSAAHESAGRFRSFLEEAATARASARPSWGWLLGDGPGARAEGAAHANASWLDDPGWVPSVLDAAGLVAASTQGAIGAVGLRTRAAFAATVQLLASDGSPLHVEEGGGGGGGAAASSGGASLEATGWTLVAPAPPTLLSSLGGLGGGALGAGFAALRRGVLEVHGKVAAGLESLAAALEEEEGEEEEEGGEGGGPGLVTTPTYAEVEALAALLRPGGSVSPVQPPWWPGAWAAASALARSTGARMAATAAARAAAEAGRSADALAVLAESAARAETELRGVGGAWGVPATASSLAVPGPFARLSPFVDGGGRMARLTANPLPRDYERAAWEHANEEAGRGGASTTVSTPKPSLAIAREEEEEGGEDGEGRRSSLLHVRLPSLPSLGRMPSDGGGGEGGEEGVEAAEALPLPSVLDTPPPPSPNARPPFALSRHEVPLHSCAALHVTPDEVTLGTLRITTAHIFFEPSSQATASDEEGAHGGGRSSRVDTTLPPPPPSRWRLALLTRLLPRRRLLKRCALELFFEGGAALLLAFPGTGRTKEGVGVGAARAATVLWDAAARGYAPLLRAAVARGSAVRSLTPSRLARACAAQEAWATRTLSSYEYLLELNTIAGRSFNDLAQYPVLPWVLADYTSTTLDLGRAGALRDLHKPVGALNPDRLAVFRDRMVGMSSPGAAAVSGIGKGGTKALALGLGAAGVGAAQAFFASTPFAALTFTGRRGEGPPLEPGCVPPFLYGSHYSTAGVVLGYLLRLEPFTRAAVELQSGRFDVPDRLLGSIPACWHGVTHAMSDVKELLPQWYTTPEALENGGALPLGATQAGEVVGAVRLPPWAPTPHAFVWACRMALEGEAASTALPGWIDLIFGCLQRGEGAEGADNVFYYTTYEDGVDVDAIGDDPTLRASLEAQIAHFGQCPSVLFSRPHPPRMTVGDGPPSALGMLASPSLPAPLFGFTSLAVEGGGSWASGLAGPLGCLPLGRSRGAPLPLTELSPTLRVFTAAGCPYDAAHASLLASARSAAEALSFDSAEMDARGSTGEHEGDPAWAASALFVLSPSAVSPLAAALLTLSTPPVPGAAGGRLCAVYGSGRTHLHAFTPSYSPEGLPYSLRAEGRGRHCMRCGEGEGQGGTGAPPPELFLPLALHPPTPPLTAPPLPCASLHDLLARHTRVLPPLGARASAGPPCVYALPPLHPATRHAFASPRATVDTALMAAGGGGGAPAAHAVSAGGPAPSAVSPSDALLAFSCGFPDGGLRWSTVCVGGSSEPGPPLSASTHMWLPREGGYGDCCAVTACAEAGAAGGPDSAGLLATGHTDGRAVLFRAVWNTGTDVAAAAAVAAGVVPPHSRAYPLSACPSGPLPADRPSPSLGADACGTAAATLILPLVGGEGGKGRSHRRWPAGRGADSRGEGGSRPSPSASPTLLVRLFELGSAVDGDGVSPSPPVTALALSASTGLVTVGRLDGGVASFDTASGAAVRAWELGSPLLTATLASAGRVLHGSSQPVHHILPVPTSGHTLVHWLTSCVQHGRTAPGPTSLLALLAVNGQVLASTVVLPMGGGLLPTWVTSLAPTPDGSGVLVGTSCGSIQVLHALTLEAGGYVLAHTPAPSGGREGGIRFGTGASVPPLTGPASSLGDSPSLTSKLSLGSLHAAARASAARVATEARGALNGFAEGQRFAGTVGFAESATAAALLAPPPLMWPSTAVMSLHLGARGTPLLAGCADGRLVAVADVTGGRRDLASAILSGFV